MAAHCDGVLLASAAWPTSISWLSVVNLRLVEEERFSLDHLLLERLLVDLPASGLSSPGVVRGTPIPLGGRAQLNVCSW